MSEFVKAAQNGDLIEVKRLFALNPGIINEKDREKDTAIMKACRDCNAVNVVAFLLENGANINDRDTIDQTPLIIAAFNGCKDIVKMLLDAGADIGHRNDQGENALISAAQEGNIDVVKVLLEAGADVNQSNADGETPLDLAIRLKQKKELIELLREKTDGAMGIKKKVKRMKESNKKSQSLKKKRKRRKRTIRKRR
jgi:ankyrin repeat protein